MQRGNQLVLRHDFSTDFESKYSINELELLAVVWSVEYFRNYVYGVHFEIVSDHKALMSILSKNRGNKTYSSRLTRWVDRLLPFEFDVVHVPGRVLGIADYLSRHPSEMIGDKISAEKLWLDWFTVNVISEFQPILEARATLAECTKCREKWKNETNLWSLKEIMTDLRQPIRLRGDVNQINCVHAQCGTKSNANSRVHKVAGQMESPIQTINQNLLVANYAADNEPKRTLEVVRKAGKVQNHTIASALAREILFAEYRRRRTVIYGRKAIDTQRTAAAYSSFPTLGSSRKGCDASGEWRHLVAPNTKRNSATSEKL